MSGSSRGHSGRGGGAWHVRKTHPGRCRAKTDPKPCDGRVTCPPKIAAALDEHRRVEGPSREAAICALVAGTLRSKRHLPRRPADAGR